MMPSRNLRWALLATVAATAWAALQPDDEPGVDVPAAASRRAAPAPGPSQVSTGHAARGGSTPTQAAAAARAGWPAAPAANRDPGLTAVTPTALAAWQPLPPPPPPPPVVAASAPVAALPPPPPAFPYTLIGRVDDGGQVQVLLSSPLRTISARVNDLVDGQWRLESIQPGGVVLVWVSGGQRQTVNYRTS